MVWQKYIDEKCCNIYCTRENLPVAIFHFSLSNLEVLFGSVISTKMGVFASFHKYPEEQHWLKF